MKKILSKLFAAAALVALPVFSLPAFAADSSILSGLSGLVGGGPKIIGGVEMTVEAAGVVNAAIGDGSSASQSIGAIESGNIDGNLLMTIGANAAVNASIGKGTCADQQIGTIGKKSTCGR